MSPRKNGFGVNNMIASCSAWWWRGVGDIFLHTWYQLSIAAARAHPFLTTVLPALWHCTQTAATVTRSQSSGAPLACGETGDSHRGYAANKSAGIMC